MSLQIWLPLIKDVQNQGICGDILTSSGVVFTNGGKLGEKYLSAGTITIPAKVSKTFFNKNNMSFAFWLYPIGSSSSSIIMGQTPMSAGNNRMYSIFQYPTPNDLHLSWQDETATSTTFLVGAWNGFFQANVWTHCCITYNGNKAIIYRNGEQYGITNGVSNRSVFEYDYPIIGNSLRKLQDVRIYDHCLSPLEVKQISQGLILHYPLNRNGWGNENLAKKANSTSTNYDFGSSPELKTVTFSGWDDYCNQYLGLTATEWNDLVGTKITYRLWLENVKQTTGTGTGIMIHFRYADGTYQQFGGGKNGAANSWLAQGESGWVWLTITVPDPTTRSTPTTISHVQYSIRHNSNNGVSTVRYKCAKVEKGSIATPWCPNSADELYSTLGLNNNIQYDTSGYGNNGTKVGISYSSNTPKYNISTVFDNNTDTVTIKPCYSVGQKIEEMSCSIWFKTSTLNSTAPNQVSLGENSFFRFRIASATSTWYYIRIGSTQCGGTFSCKNLIDNQWHHIVVIFNKGYVYVYIDSNLIGTGNHTSVATYMTCNSAGNSWHLGGYTANSENLIGSESDFRIYATALSAQDVLSLYNNSAYIDNQGNIYGAVYEEV